MTDRDSKRHEVEPEAEDRGTGTTWALPAIILAVAAIMWSSQDREEHVASNQSSISSNMPTQAPAPPK